MTNLKCVFYPHWPRNPYQRLLAERLGNLGVQVEQVGPHYLILPSLMRKGKPDILHLHALDSFFMSSSIWWSALKVIISVCQMVILRLSGVRLIWTAHDLKNHANRHMMLDRIFTILLCRLVHAIVTHCESAKREVARTFYLRNFDKIFIIPHANYVDTYENNISRKEARRKLGISEKDIVLLSLGLIRPYKGIPELIDAFKKVSHDRAKLVIAGKATTADLRELISRKAAECENIMLIPEFIPDDEIQIYMNACDATVFAFRDIFTSGSVLLAMSFSRACIAPRKGCIADVLDHLGGFLYDPKDEDGLLEAMNLAIWDKARLQNMGAHNCKVVKQWRWTRVAEMTLYMYLQFTKQQHRASVLRR
jgi:glycosyltransferase involved in cell wall biosynthesis